MAINHKKTIDNVNVERISRVFHALSSPIRLKILLYLADGEHCACEFPGLVNASQPNTSRNLLVLRNAGLVQFRKEGQKMIYTLVRPELIPWIMQLALKLKQPDQMETVFIEKGLEQA